MVTVATPTFGMQNGPHEDGKPNEPTQLLAAACKRLAVSRPNRHRPSPSSIDNCTRANWFSETGVPVDKVDPPGRPSSYNIDSYVSAESGGMTEALLTKIVNEAGLGKITKLTPKQRECLPEALKKLGLRGGQFDQMMRIFVEGTEDDVVLVEYKRMSVYGFLDLTRKGLLESHPNYYQQIQMLLAATGLARCLLVAANWDNSALTSATRGKYRPHGIYGEWIEAAPLSVVMGTQRAAMQTKHILHTKEAIKVPRDYDPFGGEKADWHCRWCPWWGSCLKAEKGK